MVLKTPAAAPHSAACLSPIIQNAIQVATPTTMLVTMRTKRNRAIWWLISSRIWTVIFFFSSEGPASFTSFRLKRSPDASRKNTKKKTSVACPANAIRLAEPQVMYCRTLIAGSSICTRVTPLGAGLVTGRLVRRLLQFRRRAL